jgi:hypothetical protein
MPLGDVSYQDAALDAVVDSWPASGANYHLYASDPALEVDPTDVELTSDGGYAPVAFDSADWDAATSGLKSTTAAVDFGTSTAAWSDVATFWAVIDTGGLIVFSDFIDEPIEVDDTGTDASFTPSLSFADGN